MDGQENADNFSRFLIIGGGISGLAAASTLAQRGIKDFRVLEARKRLGGRISTVSIGGAKAELGANWIHGILGNPVYELAAANRLVEVGQPPKCHNVAATTEDGRRVPFSILQETYEAYYWFFKRCEEYFLCKYEPPEGIKSVGEHINLEISIYLQRFPHHQRTLRRLIFDYLLKRECCITGCDNMNDVDLIGIGSYTELPGGNIQLPYGYVSLLKPLIKSLPSNCIVKDKPIKTIHWKYRVVQEEDGNASDSSVNTVKSVKSTLDTDSLPSALQSRATSVCCTPMHAKNHPNVMVECEDGDTYYADHVICTIPLGVLKAKHSTLFEPALPDSKIKAMDKLTFGTVNKIFLYYDKPFLSPDISEVITLWGEVSENLPMEDRWYRKIYSFTKLSETLLLGWISGDEARFMESLNMTTIGDVCTNVLRQFLNDPLVPKPKHCVFTAWHKEPYSMGSYTAIGLGGQQAHIEKLAEPLYQRPNKRTPVLALAGEHCHPSFYSTAHGAYLSGRAAALFYLTVRPEEEEVFNLAEASVSDLSSWLEEVTVGDKSLSDFKADRKQKETRPQRDAGNMTTPR